MSFPRSSIEKSRTSNDKDGGGLHVTNLELSSGVPSSPGIIPPRYSFLSTRRFSTAPFRRPRQNHNRSETQQSPIRVADVSPLSPSTQSAASTSGQRSEAREEGGEKQVQTEPETILDRRRCGWTIRRWVFILGPLIAIVIMAVVLAAVFVTRTNNEGGSSSPNNSGPTTTAPGASPTSTSDPTDSGPTSIAAPSGGVMKGTGLVAAYAGHVPKDKVWVYYQNAAGTLVYVALHMNNTWGTPQIVPTSTTILNGTALTAINYKENEIWKTNLLYQDANGIIQSLLYDGNSRQFSYGQLQSDISMPTSPDVVKRMSWAQIQTSYAFLYYTGTDGLLHELPFNIQNKTWLPPSTLANTNGYSGCAVSYDSNNASMTLHTISSTGQLQMFSRNMTLYNQQGTPVPLPWKPGGTLPNAKSQLGFKLDTNSTLSYSQFNSGEIFMQEQDTGEVWRVGWTGAGETQQYAVPVSTNVSLMPKVDFFTQPQITWMGRSNQAHVFVQQNENAIVHMVQQDDGSFRIVENLPT